MPWPLSLVFIDAGDVGAAALAEALTLNSTLTTLECVLSSQGPLEGDMVTARGRSPTLMDALRTRRLMDNDIGPEGARAFNAAVEAGSALTTVKFVLICGALGEGVVSLGGDGG